MFNLAMFNLSVLMFNLDCRLSCQCTEATGSNLSKLRLCDFDHRTIMLLCAIMSLVPAMMMPMSMAWRGGSGNGSGGSGGWQRDGYGGWIFWRWPREVDLEDGVATADHLVDGVATADHLVATADHLDLEDGVAMVDHLDPDNGKVMDLQVATADQEDGVAMVDHLDPDNGKVMATADHLDLEGGVHLEDHKDHGTPLRLRQDLQVGTGAQEGKRKWRAVRDNLVLALTNLAWSATEDVTNRDDDDDQALPPSRPMGSPHGYWQWQPVNWQDLVFFSIFQSVRIFR